MGRKSVRKIPTIKFSIFRSIFLLRNFTFLAIKKIFAKKVTEILTAIITTHYDAYFCHRPRFPQACELEIWLFESKSLKFPIFPNFVIQKFISFSGSIFGHRK